MQIRAMRADELEEVIHLWRTTSKATYTFLTAEHTEDEDRNYFTNVVAQNCDIWVAAEEAAITGFMAIKGSYIDRLYVLPDQQRKGIGQRLLEHARTLSPDGLELATHQKNVNACAFYEKNGFYAARYGVSPPPESEPDVEYHWRP